MLVNRIHVDADILPGVKIADCHSSATLCSGTGNSVFTGNPIADRTGLAFASNVFFSFFKHFCVCHFRTSKKY